MENQYWVDMIGLMRGDKSRSEPKGLTGKDVDEIIAAAKECASSDDAPKIVIDSIHTDRESGRS